MPRRQAPLADSHGASEGSRGVSSHKIVLVFISSVIILWPHRLSAEVLYLFRYEIDLPAGFDANLPIPAAHLSLSGRFYDYEIENSVVTPHDVSLSVADFQTSDICDFTVGTDELPPVGTTAWYREWGGGEMLLHASNHGDAGRRDLFIAFNSTFRLYEYSGAWTTPSYAANPPRSWSVTATSVPEASSALFLTGLAVIGCWYLCNGSRTARRPGERRATVIALCDHRVRGGDHFS